MNTSNWLGPPELMNPLYGTVMPGLLILTVVANSFIIFVLTRLASL